MTLRCPECPSLHPHGHSLAMHLFKSEDSDHSDYADYDKTLAKVYEHTDQYEMENIADANGDARSDPGSATTVGEPSETVPDDGVETVTDGSGGALPEATHLCDTCGSQMIGLSEFLDELEDDLGDRIDHEQWSEMRAEMLDQYERACPTCSGNGEVVAV